MLEAPTILKLWLKIVPDYTVSFVRILLCIVIVDSMARPLMTAAAATGDVKKYQSIIGGVLLSIVPVAYIVLKLGGDPNSVYVVHLAICIIAFFARLLIIRPMIKLSLRQFFSYVIWPCMLVAVASFVLSYIICRVFPDGLLYSFINCLISIIFVAFFSYIIGLTNSERRFFNEKILGILRIIRHDSNRR